jgi:hypothetical protein
MSVVGAAGGTTGGAPVEDDVQTGAADAPPAPADAPLAPADAPPAPATSSAAGWQAHASDAAVAARFSGLDVGAGGAGDADVCPVPEAHHAVAPDSFSRVEGKPGDYVTMDASWRNTSIGPAFIDGDPPRLAFNRLTADMVKGLNPEQLKGFMSNMSHAEIGCRALDAQGGLHTDSAFGDLFTDYPSMNAAQAVVWKMYASGDTQAFVRAAADAGPSCLQHIGEAPLAVLAENLGGLVTEMRQNKGAGNDGYSVDDMKMLGTTVQGYFQTNVGDDPEKCKQAIAKMLQSATCAGIADTPEKAGAFMGGLIAGLMKHFEDIKADDETRNKMMDAMFEVAGSLGPEGAAAAAVFKVGMGGLQAAYGAESKPRDYRSVAEEARGAIELDLVTNQHYPPGWSREDALAAMRSMDAAIHANGES